MLRKRKSVSDKKGGDCGNKTRKEKKENSARNLNKGVAQWQNKLLLTL
jgi:hypothetical protein